MRVTKIEIKNFRAFHGTHQFNLGKSGRNLLVYGENGSGKSSLYLALKSFLDSSEDTATRFENHQNIFLADDGHIKLHLRADPGQKSTSMNGREPLKKRRTSQLLMHQKQRVSSTIKRFLKRTTSIAKTTP